MFEQTPGLYKYTVNCNYAPTQLWELGDSMSLWLEGLSHLPWAWWPCSQSGSHCTVLPMNTL